MDNPYKLEPPALISFSGGRTSAYMLYQILQAYKGELPEGVFVCFANTGKERLETLDFVAACGEHWGVNIHWLEWRDKEIKEGPGFAEVNYYTASRQGQPFAQLISKKQFLPNPVTRYCTTHLKIQVMKRFMLSQDIQHWDNAIGLRADEPRRVAKIRNKPNVERWETLVPLADAGITLREVTEFWADSKQGFDLQLKSYEGNCDLCFLKGLAKTETIIRENPKSADWWIEQESRRLSSKPDGARFRKDRPSYAAIKQFVTDQNYLFAEAEDESLMDCFCTD